MTMKKTLAVALAAAVCGIARAQSDDPYSCQELTTPVCESSDGGGLDSLGFVTADVTSRTDCDICTNESPLVAGLEACCIAGSGVSPTVDCREIYIPTSDEISDAVTDVSEVAADAYVQIPINVSYTETAENACARTCRIYGDPEGLSFCNVRKEFILCDGRVDDPDSPDICVRNQETCESRLDYYGNACVWLPDNDLGLEWTTGSPCQMNPNFAAPVQLVYSRSPQAGNDGISYAVYATVGERGIITKVTFEYDGMSSTIDAVDCIGLEGAIGAWSSPEIEPYLDVTTVISGKQVIMDIAFEDMGVHLICQAMEINTARLDIDTLYVTTPREAVLETQTEDGFCVTSEMNTGEATQAELTENFHSYCLAKFSENLLVCRALSKECTRLSYMPTIKEFCENVAVSKLGISVKKCKNTLKKQIKREIRGKDSQSVWVEYYCRAIADGSKAAEKECIEKVADFGFLEVFDETSGQLYNPTSSVSCDLDADFTISTDACFTGVHVIVEDADGVQTTIASIPASYLACGEDIVLTGADYPEIFVAGSNVYIKQCGLSDFCSAQNGFREVAAIEITGTIVISAGTESASLTEPIVCETETSDLIYSCETQCCLAENEGAPICLNVAASTVPFCEASSAPAGVDCSNVVGSTAYVDIEIALQDAVEGPFWVTTCCRTCAAWGDPRLYAFDGWDDAPAEWIECDGRNSNNNCAFEEKKCNQQTDHLGNKCVWDETIGSTVAGDRSLVAFYGSPCQVDWAAAEAAGWLPNVTLYENGDFSVRVFTGERGVLTVMDFELAGADGYHRFDPAKCFNSNPTSAPAWTSYGDASNTPAKDGFDVACGDIDSNGLERPCAVTHADSSVFMQFRCIRTEMDGVYQGERVNVQGVSEFLPYSATGGFCLDNSIDEYRGASSTNVGAAKHCGLDGDDLGPRLTLGQTCKNIYHPSCTADEADMAIDMWCRYSAVLPLADKLSCTSDILEGTEGTVVSRWIDTFCSQFPSKKSKCKQDYTAYLDKTPTATMCFSSIDDLADFGHDPCMVGISVMDTAKDEEVLFIPDHIPACDGTLRVPAEAAYEPLFTSTIEFVKCKVSSSECPLYSRLPFIFCDPVRSYTLQLSYSSGDLCPDSA